MMTTATHNTHDTTMERVLFVAFELSEKTQMPPDGVVKFQPLDIVDVILRVVLRLRVVYQRDIKG
jgi:hypothetical protein